ncbi:penicillin-insensitive murein endopeptidase [Peteryoungia desertarenae]|uniref:Penicillin-insensitive murein endopeptidase n=2 Tax=Peteryoungia desertarenae TaxID=1813451 RepID=A0ABX6QKF8_9HYPH|nr:penicillin-insensitive murein endopeptidase [Peteryoungia desertarenae]QLF69049.1 penicillin-insensitive murein endopeptidase [Peteryoungia desertarenae]
MTRKKPILLSLGAKAMILLTGLSVCFADMATAEEPPAKELFGGMKLPARAEPQAYGFYSRGCLAGGVAIPTDGPTWQAMRLSRNRRWGHPQMISLVEQLSKDAAQYDGWPGLLLGDISQPRGGPMLSGHASHQVGLDADIWLTPMPSRTLTASERENLSATSMLKKNAFLTVDPNIWTPSHARVIMRAASYPQVERIFVNPAIKKKLCDTWTGDRSHLGKVRPAYGHDFHFHIRIKCPSGSVGCKSQDPVAAGDGCDASLAWWFTDEPWAPPKKDPNAKPAPKAKPVGLGDLPKACALVLDTPGPASEEEATFRPGATGLAALTPPSPAAAGSGTAPGFPPDLAKVPVPRVRPAAP